MVRELSYVEATREALSEELEHQPHAFVIGQDVGEHGGLFQTTTGLRERFGPQRIRNAPVCERGLLGFCIGAAIVGARPIVDLTFVDHLLYCAGDLAHQISAVPQLSGGRIALPIVIRACVGVGLSAGPFHSGNYHPLFAHLPGLRVVAPSSPREGKGLLKAAIRSNDPVILLEHKGLLGGRGPVPDDEYVALLDRSLIANDGTTITIASYGAMLLRVMDAARELSAEGISIEVIDLRCLAPLDMETIIASVAKTGRLLLVDDSYGPQSVSAEIAAQVAAHALDYLDAPVERLCARHEPVPYSPALEASHVPAVEDIVHAIRRLVQM
jgi:2-oxoisovalerate dehydrogenase E1 component